MSKYRDLLTAEQPEEFGDEFCADPGRLDPYPALADFLCRIRDEGSSIKTATLALWADDGRYKARLSDRETGRTLWLTLEDPMGLLEEIESALTSGIPGFRVDKRS